MGVLASFGILRISGRLGGKPQRSLFVEGTENLKALLNDLADAVLNGVAEPAVREAWGPVKDQAKRNAMKIGDNKSLSNSIDMKVLTYLRTGNAVAIAGPVLGWTDPSTGREPARVAHLSEFGVKPHEIEAVNAKVLSNWTSAQGLEAEIFGRSVNHPGIRAVPVFRPAYDAKYEMALGILKGVIPKFLVKEANKLAQQHDTKPNRTSINFVPLV